MNDTSKLDKDLHQKEQAIRFCLVNMMTPFLEVNVQNFRELSDVNTIITDIDVLGVKIDSTGRPRRVIFDCKTLGKTSPINRAFWAAGLMRFSFCDEAFIILRKKASEAHRLSAKQISVHLFDELQFKNYAESCSIDFNLDYCHSTYIHNWLNIFQITSGNSNLENFSNFLNNEVPIEKDAVKSLRKLLAALTKIKGELDPEKPKHQALFLFTLATFAYLMAQITHDLRNIIDYDMSEPIFEKILKYYIWGGRDSFMLRSRLSELFSSQKDNNLHSEPELKNWSDFTELTRKLLNSPNDIQACILPARELAFICVVVPNPLKEAFTASLIEKNKRIRQFTVAMAKYLVNSTKLPKDFSLNIEAHFNKLRFSDTSD